ncbi:hypothetical protein JCM6882_007031 [Rhodosporidiobolus microsporus]
MLLTLPTELVEHIVRLTVPPEYSSETYLERQNTLRDLCFVCRDVRDVAQPVLQEVVRVSKEVTVQRVKALFQSVAAKRRVRVLGLWKVTVDLEDFAKDLVALRDVRLWGLCDFDLSWLELLPALGSLVVNSCIIVPRPLQLCDLTDLTWVDSSSSDPFPSSFISSTSFPRLRHLAFWMKTSPGAHGLESWAPTISPHDLAHLDTLILPQPSSGLDLSGLQPAVLGEAYFSSPGARSLADLLRGGVRHIRLLDGVPGRSLKELVSQLKVIFTALSSPSTRLKLLYLPTPCRSALSDPTDLQMELQELLRECAVRGIRVDFEDVDESAGGPRTSPKFAAYARRMRVKEASDGSMVEDGGGQ